MAVPLNKVLWLSSQQVIAKINSYLWDFVRVLIDCPPLKRRSTAILDISLIESLSRKILITNEAKHFVGILFIAGHVDAGLRSRQSINVPSGDGFIIVDYQIVPLFNRSSKHKREKLSYLKQRKISVKTISIFFFFEVWVFYSLVIDELHVKEVLCLCKQTAAFKSSSSLRFSSMPSSSGIKSALHKAYIYTVLPTW